MAFTSVAIVSGTAALASTLFKEKELKAKEIIELSKIPQEEINLSPQLIIVQNEINSHITGVKDVRFHKVLLEIMAKNNKPVGYFSKLNGKLSFITPNHISIEECPSFSRKFYNYISNNETLFSNFMHIAFILVALSLSIDTAQNGITPIEKALSVLLAAISGFMIFNWFSLMSIIFRNGTNKTKTHEYKVLFEEYADMKKE
ncbi:Uncharacterised protein [Citrobacter youngae]|uniref:hypothetical protein n=1 Tax=Citrobacter TaxID=544 RepID=UPI000F6B8D16|nr:MULTISPECIES: hypothetical protein [Citrobacter]MDM3329602.1 hypothetical protein [Citrobacter sp. Cb130]MEB2418208.1 hypothetical protein [Citrobacter sp. R-1.5.2]VEI42525.1 Uncharacterised protein [Citrobacter youngae]